MDYAEAIAYIVQRSGYDRGFVANPFDAETAGLLRTDRLLELVGHPERRYPIVHIAGTKGKGSTAACVSAILTASGYRVGLYTSPHLHTFRERVQVAGEPLAEEPFAALIQDLARANAELAAARPDWGEATAFEVTTALALLAFARAAVDVAVVEVGLGGRLDATNVVTPAVAAITTIGLDHTAILGNSLAQIAAEKGGIIKPGCPAVSSPQPLPAAATLERIAADRGAPLLLGGRDWRTAGPRTRFDLFSPWGTDAALSVGLRGAHQVDNAATAAVACRLLDAQGIAVPETAIRDGLASVAWPGRLEVVGERPLVVVDAAHNVEAARALADALPEEFGPRPVTFILGIANDKDVEEIVRILSPLARRMVATSSGHPRAAAPERIAGAARRLGRDALDILAFPSVAAGLDWAVPRAAPDELICVTGSLYTVAEAREALGLAASDPRERQLRYG